MFLVCIKRGARILQSRFLKDAGPPPWVSLLNLVELDLFDLPL